jgi:DsbC/DsbD-like thiol-disulfide interchange protein
MKNSLLPLLPYSLRSQSLPVNWYVIKAMKRFALLFGLLALVGSAFAQAQEPTVSVSAPPKSVAAGSKITLTLTLTFAPGLHGYQNPPAQEYEIPVTVKVDGKDFKVVKVAYPAGVDVKMGGADKPTKAYEGTIKIPVTITVPAKLGAKDLKFVVSYQQCDESTCFPPGTVSATAKVNIVKKVAKV